MNQAPAVPTHQLFKGMLLYQCLWYPMPHLCSHEDPAMPRWHQDAWSRKSKNSQPRLFMDLVIVMHCCIHPSQLLALNCSVSYSQKGGCCIIIHFISRTDPSISWSHLHYIYILVSHFYHTWHLDLIEQGLCTYILEVLINSILS